MNWNMIAAVAGISCLIGVVVALLYLAWQIKETRRQKNVETYHSILDEMGDFAKLMAQDAANSDIWWRASKGLENLTDVERVRYFAMLFIPFRSWEKTFHYHSEGGRTDWRGEVLTRAMADFAMSRGVQEYWALRRRWYTEDFQSWVDDTMKRRAGIDVYGEEFRIFGSADVKRRA